MSILFQGESAPTGQEESLTDTLAETSGLLQEWLVLGKDWLINDGPGLVIKFLVALVIFVIGRWIAHAVTNGMKRVLNARNLDATLVGFLGNIVYAGLLTMVIIAVLGQLGIPTAQFAAIIAAAGLAIAFALQGSLSNFAAGVMVIMFKPFRVGDFIEAAGVAGTVLEVGIFATVMKTGDNKKMIIPNGSIMGDNIINYSANDTRRIDLVFGIDYGDDIKLAKTTLEKVCAADERILKEPAVTIAVSELGDNSVNLVCRPWVNSSDYWPVKFDLTEAVKLEFDRVDLSFPFPQRDVHLHEVQAS